jgi:FemAB-related protein (PEP-CTERM system-associated)
MLTSKAHALVTSVLEPQDFPQWRNQLSQAIAENTALKSERMIDSLRWLSVLKSGLNQEPYCIQICDGCKPVGVLPLVLVKSAFFGRHLVSLPYVNSAGIVAETEEAASRLIDGAVHLADRLNVRYLELRHEMEIAHPALGERNDSKVLMRLALPGSGKELWNGFKSKLRSQVRAGEKHGFEICWGKDELLSDFYAVFSRNMRDLGTPVYSRRLFSAVLASLSDEAELCVVKRRGVAVAAALLLHSCGTTEVPSASSLREHNATNANMVMYWNMLLRAVDRGQRLFNFGRSTVNSGTYRFKQQWGAEPSPSVWQYYLRRGTIRALRPDNARFSMAIKVWQRLPVVLTRCLGPAIVRGIP